MHRFGVRVAKPVGNIVVGIYGKRNFLEKSPGSGWWVVSLARRSVITAGLYGCKFSAQGDIEACGRSELDPRINDMAIVQSSRY